MTAVLPAIALACHAGSAPAKESVDPCTVLYEEAKSYGECFAYEAYLEQCPAHVFSPLARTLAERSCRARDDLIALQLDLEAERQKAEETLTLLAAAEQVKAELAGVVEELEGKLVEAIRLRELLDQEMRNRLDVEEGRLADAKARLAGTESELAEAREEIVRLATRLADPEGELTDARDEIAGMATRLAATDDELAGARDDMARMQSRLDDATAEVARLTDLLAAQSSLAERQKGELDEARAQLEAGQARLDQSGQDALRLQERIDEQQRMITALSRQRDEAAAQVRQLARLEDNETELRKILALAVEELREARKDREEALAAAESGEQSRLDAQERVLEQSRQITVLNLQINDLRRRLKDLGETLDVARAERDEGEVEIISLGSQLNEALASLAAESSRARQLEIAERERLEREKQELEGFRSEFLGRLRKIMEDTDGVSISGDRFVFAAEVLFPRGEAELSEDGKAQIRNVARLIIELAGEFPERIDWVLRVDGHTDDIPLLPDKEFADNWELSQARSLSVVRYLVSELGFPQNRLAAAGFGEFRPVNPARSEAARAQNRRIEFRLTDP